MSPFTTPLQAVVLRRIAHRDTVRHFQLWSFVAPGLYRNERRFAVPLLVSSIVLFYVGIAFAYYFVFPGDVSVLTSTSRRRGDDDRHQQYLGLRAHDVFLLRTRVRECGCGGAAGRDGHRADRETKEHRGYVLIGIFILAALLTLPTPFAMLARHTDVPPL